MAARMVAVDHCVFSQDDEGFPLLIAVMNDVFSSGAADGEEIPWDKFDDACRLWMEHGWPGLLVWTCKKRNCLPLDSVYDQHKTLIDLYCREYRFTLHSPSFRIGNKR